MHPYLTLQYRRWRKPAAALLALCLLAIDCHAQNGAAPMPPVTSGLTGYWALDGNWTDSTGDHDLAPLRAGGFAVAPFLGSGSRSYGPTGQKTGNGAVSAQAIAVDRSQGVTMSGWFMAPHESAGGTLFGFGQSWEDPKMLLTMNWGFVWLHLGAHGDGVSIQLGRFADRCWHHVAVVIPAAGDSSAPLRAYIDGQETAPTAVDNGTLDVATVSAASLFGAPFRVGQFNSADGADEMRVDNVGLWSRALSAQEVGSLSQVGGQAGRCPPPPLMPAVTAQLSGYWALDGNWTDSTGAHDLTPAAAGGFASSPFVGNAGDSYGPTGRAAGNGAVSAQPIMLDRSQGVTMSGWFFAPHESAGGNLFGFGQTWDDPKMLVAMGWGYVWVHLGAHGNGASVRYGRFGDNCWHHLTVVLAAPDDPAGPLHVYVDGQETAPDVVDSGTLDHATIQAASLFGAPFQVGQFNSADGAGEMRVDNVGLWSRALSVQEVGQLSQAGGAGPRCPAAVVVVPPGGPTTPPDNGPPGTPPVNDPPGPPNTPPTPPPSCTFPATTTLGGAFETGVRILDSRNIVIVSDPNPWLKQRIASDCGAYLQALDARHDSIAEYIYFNGYVGAIKSTVAHYRPGMLAALGAPDYYQVQAGSGAWQTASESAVWPQATSEFRYPAPLIKQTGFVHGDSAEVIYFSYLTLPFDMQNGMQYSVRDPAGNTQSFAFDDHTSLSWAIKANQLGFAPQAGGKFAYLGAWRGAALGALDLSRFEGQPFEVLRDSDQTVAFSGQIALRADDQAVTGSGEMVYDMDFSALTAPGTYFLRVPGVGRSRTFEVNSNALGVAFYIHARGLYHQRCGMDISAQYTAWPRGDSHTTVWKGAFPPNFPEDYADNTGAGWGFRDENGNFPVYPRGTFDAVRYTATEEIVPNLRGGWHDAGDFDRSPSHLGAINDLVHAYLMFPQNFTDGQLNLPESGNGIPDILDEAAWGMEVWRLAQQDDGATTNWIEAISHPALVKPGMDPQRYYRGLATRNSSLAYAASAALMGRALVQAGDATRGALFIASAVKAYQFADSAGPAISVSFQVDSGAQHSWTEGPIEARKRFYALVQLWLATSDPVYQTRLAASDMQASFEGERVSMYWRTNSYDFSDIVLEPNRFPAGWAAQAQAAVTANADEWLGYQARNPYRNLWYRPGEGYFGMMGWGADGFRPAMHLVAAWRFSQDAKYYDGALWHVDWMHGGNPQGRVNTTGLGQYNATTVLHLPSETDGIDDPVPGLTLYGYTGGVAWGARTRIYGLFEENVGDFAGAAMAQLPAPWNDPTMQPDAIKAVLEQNMPVWRGLYALEGGNVDQMEFTTPETIAKAAAVVGPLMGTGWTASAALKARKPRSKEAMRDSLWFQP